MSEENIVYVGNRPPMTYVAAVLAAFNSGGAKSVTLKARGRAISSAVDVAEICRNRFMTDLKPPTIEISTEQLPTQDGGTRGVSSMSITLTRGGAEAPKEESKQPPTQPQKRPEKAPTRSVALSEIKGVGKTTEEKLREAGFKTARSVASAKPETLARKTEISEKVAAKLIEAAKKLLE